MGGAGRDPARAIFFGGNSLCFYINIGRKQPIWNAMETAQIFFKKLAKRV